MTSGVNGTAVQEHSAEQLATLLRNGDHYYRYIVLKQMQFERTVTEEDIARRQGWPVSYVRSQLDWLADRDLVVQISPPETTWQLTDKGLEVLRIMRGGDTDRDLGL